MTHSAIGRVKTEMIRLWLLLSLALVANSLFSTSKAKLSSKKVIAVTGSSGLVGSELVRRLQEDQSIQVLRVTTDQEKASKNGMIYWDITNKKLDGLPEGLQAVVHLAGENIATGSNPTGLLRNIPWWSSKKKDKILNSRIDGTKVLVDTISKMKVKPKAFICASAVGLYGPYDNNQIFTEKDDVGKGFLAQVVQAWEREAFIAKTKGIRTVALRFGVVLSKNGGILAKILPIFKLGLGGKLGSGEQGFAFVHIDDVVESILFAINKSNVEGAYNVVGDPIDNNEFTKALGEVLNRPTILPVPNLAIFGDFGSEVLFGGQKVSNSKLVKAGFKFQFSNIGDALRGILSQ